MKNKKRIFWLATIVIIIFLLIYFFQKQTFQLNIEELKEFIRSFGILGPLVFILMVIISMVLSPLTSFPFWLASLSLYGFWLTWACVLIANNLGSVINFWIARRWGRSLVVRFVGKRGMKKIDEIVEIVGLQILVIGRVFGGASGDFLSYAVGLTTMKFRPYLLITVFGTLPVITLNIYVVHRALTINPMYLVILAVIGYSSALTLPVIIYRKKIKSIG